MERSPSVLPHTNQLSDALLLLLFITESPHLSPPPPALQIFSSMAALWLQSVSLLVLLIVSCPGSQAIATPQHLCGSLLFDALYLVCGDRGFFYNPKRDVDQNDQMERMVKRGIVEQCCYKPCNIVDLQNFCN